VIEPHAEVREGALQVPEQIFANFRTLLRAAGVHPHAPAPYGEPVPRSLFQDAIISMWEVGHLAPTGIFCASGCTRTSITIHHNLYNKYYYT